MLLSPSILLQSYVLINLFFLMYYLQVSQFKRPWVTLSDTSEIFNGMTHHTVSLRQLSFLFRTDAIYSVSQKTGPLRLI